jgi:hypothetical protein
MTHPFLNLLGKQYTSIEVQNALIREGGMLKELNYDHAETGTISANFLERGISFTFDLDLRLESIHINGGHESNSSIYSGELPFGISFGDDSATVIVKAGIPSVQGGGGKSVLYGLAPVYERYDIGKYSVHFQHSPKDQGVNLVTVFCKKLA